LFHDAVKLGSLAGRRMAPQRYLIAAKLADLISAFSSGHDDFTGSSRGENMVAVM
jgi:hypothetical protein